MSTPVHIFSDIQGAFLVALKNGSYHAGVRTRSFPASSSLQSRMPPVYQQSMRGTCVANAATALVEYYEDCKARLSIQFLHEMTKTVERNWIDGNLDALAKGESVDPEFGTRFASQVAQIRLTSDANGVGSPAAQAFLNAFARQIKSHFGIQAGSSIRHCFDAIRDYGVCRYSLWPYANVQTDEVAANASFPPGSKEDAQKHRILTGLYILRSPNNVDEIRGIIAGANARRPMPVCVGLALFEGCDKETFEFPEVVESEGRYVSGNAMKGVHEMLIVGYEDNPKAPGGGWFTVRNSWGADWGKNGYGRVPYAYVECFCTEAGTILQDMVDYAGDGYGGIAGGSSAPSKGGKTSRILSFVSIAGAGCLALAGLLCWRGGEVKSMPDKAPSVATPVVDQTSEKDRDRIKKEEEARKAKEAAELAAKEKAEKERLENEKKKQEAEAKRLEELKRFEEEKKALELEKAKIAEEKRKAEEKAEKERREKVRKEAEAKRLEEERIRREAEEAAAKAEAERLAKEAAAKAEAERKAKEEAAKAEAERLAREKAEREAKEKAIREAEELKKPVDYVFHMTISCSHEEERAALLTALSKISAETGFYLSEIRSEGKSSMWGGARLTVRCDMTISAPRNRRPNARKLLSDFLMKECQTEDPVDWSHASRIMSVQDFSSTATGAGGEKKSHGGVRLGF